MVLYITYTGQWLEEEDAVGVGGVVVVAGGGQMVKLMAVIQMKQRNDLK